MKLTIKAMLAIFLLLALAFTINAETIHLTYSRPTDSYIVLENTTNTSINLTLPKTDLDLDIQDENETFKVTIPALSIATVQELNLSAQYLDHSNISDAALDLGPSDRYRPIRAYAFSIDNEDQIDDTYTVRFDYSDLSVSYDLVVFQFDYDFTTNESDYSSSQLHTSNTGLITDTSNEDVIFTTENFSSFILAEDHNNPVYVPSTGGGGGGGGGGISDSSLITVIPTVEGAVVTAPTNTIFDVVYEDQVYPVEFVFANGEYVKLKNMITQEYWIFLTGLPKKIDFDGVGSDDIMIVLADLQKGSGTFVFTLLDSKAPITAYAALPPREKTEEPTETTAPEIGQPITPTPTIAPPTTATPPITETPLPESPISLLTILIPLLLLIVLVGGIAVYRRHSTMDRPPAAVRTGQSSPLSGSELPPTTSDTQRPAPSLLSKPILVKPKPKPEPVVVEQSRPVVVEQPKLKPRPGVSHDRLKMLEKYVYHGLAEGFSKEQIHAALIRKGWPQNTVDTVFEHVEFTDEHVEAHDLHIHTEVDRGVDAVYKLLEKGFDEQHIRAALRRKGWKSEQIDEVFEKI